MPHLTLSEADRQLLRLRVQCRWPLRRLAKSLGVHHSTISRRLAQIQNRHGLTHPRRPTPKRRNDKLIPLSTLPDA
ncbi:MAG TPA: Lrp/AsnC family transcriptional regulator [Tepidisphaeraceae bacterium]